MKISRIADLLGAPAIAGADAEVTVLLTDSRSLIYPERSLFFALSSNGNDGHRYIRDLYAKGVRNFVVEHFPEDLAGTSDANIFIVPDTLAALQTIGSHPREKFKGEVVAITGSRGKTILKEWAYRLFAPHQRVVRSPRSYNSQIGVPLSLWEIAPDTDLAIIEAGIDRPGEMRRLAPMIAPDIVVLTNITEEHDEGFESREAKIHEKLDLVRCSAPRLLIYNGDDPMLRAAVEALGNERRDPDLLRWSFADPHAPLYISPETGRYLYSPTGENGVIPLAGRTPAEMENLGSLLALALARGAAPEGFDALKSVETRLNVSEGVNNCTIIHDNFTSDILNLPPVLDFMRRRVNDDQTTTLILADPEDERFDEYEAAKVAELVERIGIHRFIGVGPKLTRFAALFPENSRIFPSESVLMEALSTSDFDHEVVTLRGSDSIPLREMLLRLETRTHETVLEVNLDAMVKNFNYFRSHLPAGTGLIAMVKASAYGAGSYEVARTMQDHGAAYLAVAVLDEGIELRHHGIHMPIMVMNPKVVNYKAMFQHNLEPEIYNLPMLREVIAEGRKYGVKNYPVHIKLDTGMHRMGFVEEELPEVMDILEDQDFVMAKSVFSHLATADCPDMDDYTLGQLKLFTRLTEYMQSRSSHPLLRHILNSAGILRFPDYHFDMARLGIGLYGVNTLPPEMEKPLAPVSALRTLIISLRHWPEGSSIGYGRKGILERDSMIATIPIGYADGMNRHYGRGNLKVLVNGKEAPTIGNICMDACMIDVTGIDCREGDEVEVFGPNISLDRMAQLLDTIPYEILTSVSPRVKRVYFRE